MKGKVKAVELWTVVYSSKDRCDWIWGQLSIWEWARTDVSACKDSCPCENERGQMWVTEYMQGQLSNQRTIWESSRPEVRERRSWKEVTSHYGSKHLENRAFNQTLSQHVSAAEQSKWCGASKRVREWACGRANGPVLASHLQPHRNHRASSSRSSFNEITIPSELSRQPSSLP